MNEIHTTICGNLCGEPAPRTTSRGEPMVTFRLASTPWRWDKDARGYVDGDTSFVSVVAYRHLARHVVTSLRKGEPVVVHGRLKVVEWEQDGRTRSGVEIEADTIGHDLSRGVTSFRRVSAAESVAPPRPSVPPPATDAEARLVTVGSQQGSSPDPADADRDAYEVRGA